MEHGQSAREECGQKLTYWNDVPVAMTAMIVKVEIAILWIVEALSLLVPAVIARSLVRQLEKSNLPPR